MDTGVIIAIVIAALLLLALFAVLGRSGRKRKQESNRQQASEIRREAEVGQARADKERAEADVQSAEARRQEADARERSVRANEQQREARDRHLEAAKVDPDVDEDAERERYDREHSVEGVTAHGHGAASPADSDAAGGDQRVEHYERTETPDEEHERHFERDEHGEVVREEEHREPRS